MLKKAGSKRDVQCAERCFGKSNIFTSSEKDMRVKWIFFWLFCS